MQHPFIGRKVRGADLWIMPFSWRARWRSNGGRIVRSATEDEVAAFKAWPQRPVALSKVVTAAARIEPDVGPADVFVAAPAPEPAPAPRRRRRATA